MLNMERNGYSVAVYGRTTSRAEAFIEEEAEGTEIRSRPSLRSLQNFSDDLAL